jgi:hypothetical protein
MATTFVFPELDTATREYLLEVRNREGRGTPGVFAPVKNAWPTVGCCLGPVIIGLTLAVTLSSGIIFDDPGGVALLQTAGILVGGWMVLAAFRVWARRRSRRVAGHWVYVDPLHLFEARGEQVKVTRIDDAVEAQFTHNYSNNAYQNSVVRVLLPGNAVAAVTLNHEQRAEQMVTYLNYLAWARGPEGGERATLSPAVLGGLAKYVAKNDNEPLDHDGNVNLNLVELDIGEVPEQPAREGRALPNILPYVVLALAGVASFVVMREVNTQFRDDRIFETVTTEPVEPRYLRAYLVDPRNTRHRDQVFALMPRFYDPAVSHVKASGADPNLRDGMAQVLESLKKADQPVVSIRVKETASPDGQGGGASDRENRLRSGIAEKTNEAFAAQPWGVPVMAPPGVMFTEPPPPLGHQLIAYVEAPEGENPHFDISYAFEKDKRGNYTVAYKVAIRVRIDEQEVARQQFELSGMYTAAQADRAVDDLRDRIIRDMIGAPAPAPK